MEEYKATMSAGEIKSRLAEAKVKLLEAQAATESVKAKKVQLAFDKECDSLVYIDTALDEFNSKLKLIVDMIRHLPDAIGNDLKLEPDQYVFVKNYTAGILSELSKITFEFSTTNEIDARAASSHSSKKANSTREKRA